MSLPLRPSEKIRVWSLLGPFMVLGRRRTLDKAEKVSGPALAQGTGPRLAGGPGTTRPRTQAGSRAGQPRPRPLAAHPRPSAAAAAARASAARARGTPSCQSRAGLSSARRERRRRRRRRRRRWDPSERSAASWLHLLHGSGDRKGAGKALRSPGVRFSRLDLSTPFSSLFLSFLSPHAQIFIFSVFHTHARAHTHTPNSSAFIIWAQISLKSMHVKIHQYVQIRSNQLHSLAVCGLCYVRIWEVYRVNSGVSFL